MKLAQLIFDLIRNTNANYADEVLQNILLDPTIDKDYNSLVKALQVEIGRLR